MLSALLIPLTIYWQFQMESVRNATHPSAVSLPFHVVFVVLCVTGINRVVARLFGERFALHRGELLLIYSLLALSSAIAGIDTLQVLVPIVTYGFRFSEANGWSNILPHLPPHLTIHDPTVYDHYYTGNDTLWQRHLLAAWLPVVGRWTVFIALLLWVMLCINATIRRAWMDDERLNFPLVQLPLQITDNEAWTRRGLAGNPLFWMGALAAGIPDMLNSLNYFFPAVPAAGYTGNGYSYVDLRYLPGLDTFLTHAPWNAIGETPVAFYPFVISLGMLMPLDFLFSIPVFYWFWKLQRVAVTAAAWDVNPRFPYVESQAFGAYLSFCLLSLYVSRRHLRGVWDRACGRHNGLDDTNEPMPYRVAVWGGLAGVFALIGFARSMGLSPLLGAAFFVIYFALSLAITRMRAELGTPVHDLHFTGPEMLLTRIGGTRAFAAHDLVPLGLLQWFTQAHRSNPMPYQLESFRLCDAAGAESERRRWTAALMVGGVFASFVGFLLYLDLMYHYGANAQVRFTQGYGTYDRIAGWLSNPTNSDPKELLAILLGFALAALMQAARLYIPGFPLHPLAFAVTSSYQMGIVWLPLTIAWMVKAVLLRFGGLRAFRQSLPFFWGMMVGQFIVGSGWNILGTLVNVPTYRFWD